MKYNDSIQPISDTNQRKKKKNFFFHNRQGENLGESHDNLFQYFIVILLGDVIHKILGDSWLLH